MPPERILTELIDLAHRLGVEVRSEPFDVRVLESKGGLCWVHGRPAVYMDSGMALLDKIGVLAEALSTFDIEAMYVPPAIRARIERRRFLVNQKRRGFRA